MVKREFTFPSADGKTAIHAVEWLPEGAPRAVLQIAHGVSEYVLRYEDFAGYLTERGFAVVGNDHLGHGLSVADGAPRLYFGPKGSWNWVVEDMEQLRKLTHEKFPNLPYFLLGHSMGSFLTRTLLFRYPDAGLRAAVICGTGWQPAPVLAAGLALCGLEKLRLGETGRSKLLVNLMFGAYNRKFPDARTPNDWICSDPEVVAKYTADPLCGQDATIGLTREMLRGIRMIQRPANLQRMDKALPVFFIAGRSDPVGNMGRGVEKTAAAFRAAGMQDVACKLYDGRHEILNEKNRQLVYDDVLAFYERHLD